MSLINLAIRQAAQSQCRYKIGAVLAAGSRVIVTACNKQRNSPLIDHRNSTFHAEEAALRRARTSSVTTIYVARVNASGLPMMARPCPDCVKKLASAGISRAYYTVSGSVIGEMAIGVDDCAYGQHGRFSATRMDGGY
ncbi:deaminase [Streptomyces lavendulocolor]|uniref:deaminase n=1 Tax=Streptomyces lavendulocolor TaxID=67316 RepID=UPI0033D17C4C